MLKNAAKLLAIGLAVLIVSGVVLYAAGLRVVTAGSGRPSLAFTRSAESQAERIARHREAQRAQETTTAPPEGPAPEPIVEETPVADGTTDAPAGDDPAPAGVRTVETAARPGIYWTDFRGPARDGEYRERPIRTDWPAGGLTPIWKQPAGGGYASFVVAEGRAFTIEQRGQEEVVAAYDVATGREVWTNSWRAAFRERMGGDGPRATPAWAGGRVYALGAEGELRALDAASGRTIWRVNILEDNGAVNLQWGMAASPLVVDDTVVVLPGGPNGRSVVAYDLETGRRAWSALDDQQAYSSPMLVTLGGVRQILVFSASRLLGLTPDGSRVLWEHPWKTQFEINASQPIVVDDRHVFVSTGYGTGAALLELSPQGDGFTTREVWRNASMKNRFASSMLHDGHAYGLDEGILACVDVATGDVKWKGGRYGHGQTVLASGHIIVLTEQGELALVRATPTRHEEIVRFPALDGKTWNHPALADGHLLIRNLQEMAAFDLRRASR